MWDTASRSFEVLRKLQRKGFVAGGTLAFDFGVTTRTIRRDVARLRDLGYPIDTRLGIDGGYSLEPGTVLPPIFLSVDEALACTLALRQWNEAAEQHLAAGVLQKVLASVPKRVQWIMAALDQAAVDLEIDGLREPEAAPVDVSVLGDLARACVLHRRVEFLHTDRSGKEKMRKADSSALVHTARRWYFVAFDLDRDEWRTYRVDRISVVTVTEAPVRGRVFPGAGVEAWVDQQLRSSWQQVTATVRIHAPLEAVSRWMAPAWGTVEADSAGSVIVRAGADSYDSIARWLLLVQADIDVIKPAELRAAFGRIAAQAARSATDQAGTGSALTEADGRSRRDRP
ncbi:WYL domain-containing protein [Arthrobacter sp. zg-Y859]|uniref:WYL domain-containing protein n=1 Tax=Arthrobacter jinronghuae TaxID=2964609 RepID=A0ABT1NP00_9MICC|nr:WYL domain-containing protein [Arthrobacter jinronghuae]MCQ1949460.1 WYL domain-containing protein [Arthrobacter jinronghuae]UWX77766.1 WYL domain-containing protein [Arthrobacter jinronghuae]